MYQKFKIFKIRLINIFIDEGLFRFYLSDLEFFIFKLNII